MRNASASFSIHRPLIKRAKLYNIYNRFAEPCGTVSKNATNKIMLPFSNNPPI